MVGGKVIEVIDVKDKNKVWVNCQDKYSDTCAIYVERNNESLRIAPGDSLWWQSNKAMWTPQYWANCLEDIHAYCGVRFDIQIPRIGYSGVSRPQV